jgi:EAL domain-containing protein (putative c-di-GMP-specific phosphodiesterase class I)/tetratricopeptide (TPR) repeat protein
MHPAQSMQALQQPAAFSRADWQMAVARGLNRESERKLDTDPVLCRQHFENAETIARALGANGILAISLLMRARLYHAEARFDDALRTCNEAAIIAACDGDIAAQAKTMSGLSAIWANLGLGEEALPHLEFAADLLADRVDTEGLALVRSLLGGVEAQLGRTQSGVKQFEQALAGFRALGMRGRVLETLHNMACLCNLEERFADALALSEQNAAEALRQSNSTLLAHIEATCVEALCGLGRFDEAVAHARSALALARPGSRGELDIMLWLGTALEKAGKSDDALAVLRDTLRRSDLAHMPVNRPLLAALARVCRRTGNIVEADQYDEIAGHRSAHMLARVVDARLEALEMTVELQGRRLRLGRDVADRVRLQAQLERTEGQLDQARTSGSDQPGMFFRELHVSGSGFDRDFNGEAFGFSLAYQPIIRLSDGSVSGFEALLRLGHPVHGRMLPLEFIRRIEASGEIATLGHWVLRKVCQDLALLPRGQGRDLRIAINVSPHETDRADFAGDTLEVLRRAGLGMKAVELELTDSISMPTRATLTEQLNCLRESGVQFAMIDHGTGSTNAAFLAAAAVSRIRIDRNLISGIGRSARHVAALRDIVQSAKVRNVPVLAEGIENAPQLAELRALGCDEGQGFVFSEAVPLDIARQLIGQSFPT